MIVNINFKPHKAQQQIIDLINRYKIVTAICGRSFGKTYLALYMLLYKALENPKPAELKCLYIAKTFKQAYRIAWDRLTTIVPEEIIIYKNKADLTITLANNCSIHLIGCDIAPDDIRGFRCYFLVLDEFMYVPINTWINVLRPTLLDKHSKALLIGTMPDFKKEYINKEWLFYIQKLKSSINLPDTAYIQFPSTSNPYLPQSEINKAISEASIVGKLEDIQREYFNEYQYSSALIFPNFDPNKCLTAYNNIPIPKLQTLMAIDPHLDGSCYILYAGVNENNDLICFNEIYLQNATIREIAYEIFKYEKNIPKPKIRLIDPITSRYSTKILNPSNILIQFQEAGLYLLQANPDFNNFKTKMDELIKANKLIITHNCKLLVQQLLNYQWEHRKCRTTANQELKPKKLNDHLIDCLKYIINSNYKYKNIIQFTTPYKLYRDSL
jgi:hypothetical protein